MLRAIIKKELLGHLASFRFLISTLIMLILAALAASVGAGDYDLRWDHHQARLERHSESLERVSVYSQLHPKAARAPEPLSVLHRGFDARLGTEVQLDVYSIPTQAADAASGNPLGLSPSDFDLTTIVRVVLGLLALLLTFDTVVGERESQTLKLVLANSISRPTLIAGKFFGALLALLAPLLAGAALSLWILNGRVGVLLDAERWQRVAGLLLAYVAYLAVMLLLGLVLSVAARTTAGALVYSLLSWLMIVFLIPQSAVAVAGVIAARSAGSPADQAVAKLAMERDETLLGLYHEPASRPLSRLDQAPVHDKTEARGVLYRYGSADYYDTQVELHSRETALGMEYADRIFELEKRADERRRRIESLARMMASPSPAFLMERIAASYAGTSVDDHDRFLEDCRHLRQRFIDYLEWQEAFTSWRWFTDDTPRDHQPWPHVLGVTADSVGEAEIEGLMRRWLAVDVQQRVLLVNDDPGRRLTLPDLPALHRTSLDVWQASRRVSPEILLLVLLNGILAGTARWRFSGYSPR